jgi:predicted nucleic acid-binding protein
MFSIDTNIVAELRKAKAGKADANVVMWNNSLAPEQAYLSAITVLEFSNVKPEILDFCFACAEIL